MTDSVLFYGLGSMGTGMAHSLRRAGFRVNAFTNKPEVRQAFIDAGGESTDLAAFAPQATAVVIAVVNAAQTEDILFGSTGLAERLPDGCVVIACPTIDRRRSPVRSGLRSAGTALPRCADFRRCDQG